MRRPRTEPQAKHLDAGTRAACPFFLWAIRGEAHRAAVGLQRQDEIAADHRMTIDRADAPDEVGGAAVGWTGRARQGDRSNAERIAVSRVGAAAAIAVG